jgi:hypothetical protein
MIEGRLASSAAQVYQLWRVIVLQNHRLDVAELDTHEMDDEIQNKPIRLRYRFFASADLIYLKKKF